MYFFRPTSLTGQFPIKGLLGSIFHFYSNLNRTFCKQTVENLIRMWRMIRLFTVCRCPIKRMQGLNGLIFFGETISSLKINSMFKNCVVFGCQFDPVIWLPFNAKKTLFSLHHSKYLGIQRFRANRIERLSPLHDTRMKTGFKLHMEMLFNIP